MIKNVDVIPGCISCRNCESVCPDIFHLDPTSQVISKDFNSHAISILQAARMCPVQVIKVDTQMKLIPQKAQLRSKKYLTPDTLELTFLTKNFQYKPGQYVSVLMNDIKGEFSRSYSLADAHHDFFTLTVKILQNGRGAKYLQSLSVNKYLKYKNQIQYLGANGVFVLKDTQKPKVFIATGTGLAPMMSMIKNTPEAIEKILLFGVRYEKDLYYLEELQQYKNLKIITSVSQPDSDYSGNIGRVTDNLDIIDIHSEVYICGNPNMVDSVEEKLKENNHPEDHIHIEGFTVAPKSNTLLFEIFQNGLIPYKKTISWIIIIFSLLVVPYSLWNQYNGINFYHLSWYAVMFVMFIRPLSQIFPKVGFFRGLSYFRKAFGILSASIVVSIFIINFIKNPFLIQNYISLSSWTSFYSLSARISEITAIILLITSNIFSQKILGGYWKSIQSSSYLYFITGGIIAARWGDEYLYYGGIIIWIILYIAAFLKQKTSK